MILHFLRHVSVCLWIALLIGGLGSFLLLALLQPAVGVDAAPLLAAGLLTAGFAAAAWTANRLGLGRVRRLMHRADRAERDGLRKDAERSFQRALGVLDSFWVSPRARRRTLLPLAGRIARYYLSESRLSQIAEDFIARYLWACPGDAEVAKLDTDYKTVLDRGDNMKAKGAAYFEAWEKQLAAITTPDVKEVADKRKADLTVKYTALMEEMSKVREMSTSVFGNLKDIEKILGNDLNAEGLKSIAPMVQKLKDSRKPIRENVDAILAKLGDISAVYSRP